jgi:sortase A
MRARLTWKDDSVNARSRRKGLRLAEWMFLLIGLIAVDVFVWVNAGSVLYQAYEDWAFDQQLRGLSPSVPGFMRDESHWLFNGRESAPATAETPKPVAPSNQPPVAGPPAPQSVVGRLEIPRLKVAVMVREGADESTLSRAVGHIPGTALPGNIGNVGLAGHRDTFFRALRNIKANDTIEVQTTTGTYRYMVSSTKIVTPRDVSVLQASGGETLTLVTCYPFYYVGSAPKRFIVHATQVAATPQRQPLPSS